MHLTPFSFAGSEENRRDAQKGERNRGPAETQHGHGAGEAGTAEGETGGAAGKNAAKPNDEGRHPLARADEQGDGDALGEAGRQRNQNGQKHDEAGVDAAEGRQGARGAPNQDHDQIAADGGIAKSIECCLSISQPILSVVIGEGGSGGAIALATSNKVLMLEHAIYSVISPEGCASILWKDASKSKEAAESMQITAQSLLKNEIIDEVIKEPLGGAHRNPEEASNFIKQSLIINLRSFSNKSSGEIIADRKNKFLSIGSKLPEEVSVFDHDSVLNFSKEKLIKNKKIIIFLGVLALGVLIWLLN